MSLSHNWTCTCIKFIDMNSQTTSYDGQEITYDELGNPLSYLGWDMTWYAGRRLSTMKNGSMDISFTYNDEGIRTSKTVDGETTAYTSIDGRITSQNDGTNQLYFRYDKNDSLTGFNLNGTEYIYVKNAQEDITGILDKDGQQVVSYTYDAWGKVESISGSSADTIGKINPMRYRGYYEDTETGLYYLQSRYYNAEMGRFINADEPEMFVLCATIYISKNMFAYVGNNPVNMIDPNGYFGFWIKVKTDTVAWIIDIAISAIGFGVAAKGVVEMVKLLKAGRVYIRTAMKKALKEACLGALASFLDLVFVVLDKFTKFSSIDGIIANTIDWLDGDYDGRIKYYIKLW